MTFPFEPREGFSKAQNAVLARSHALDVALKDPYALPKNFIESCKNSPAFARYQSADLGIARIGSRNTYYKHAEALVSGGRKDIEARRRKVYAICAPMWALQASRNMGDFDHAPAGDHDYEDRLRNAQECIVKQSKAFFALWRTISALLKSDKVNEFTKKALSNTLNELDEMFSDVWDPDVVIEMRPNNVRNIRSDENG